MSTFGAATSSARRSAPETTTGGNALKFYASVRLDIRKIGVVKNGEQPVGNKTRVKVVKNKVAPPFRECEFEIVYRLGVNATGTLACNGSPFCGRDAGGSAHTSIIAVEADGSAGPIPGRQ